MSKTTNRFAPLLAALLLGFLLALFASPALAQMGGGMMGPGGQGYGHGYGPGYGQGYGGGNGPGYGPGYGMGPQGYGQPYTAEQQTIYWDLARKYSPKQSELASKLWPLQAELNAALAAEKPDMANARKLTAKIGDLMGEMYKQRMEFFLELREKGLPVYNMMGGGMMGGGMMGPGMMGPGMMGPGMMGGW